MLISVYIYYPVFYRVGQSRDTIGVSSTGTGKLTVKQLSQTGIIWDQTGGGGTSGF